MLPVEPGEKACIPKTRAFAQSHYGIIMNTITRLTNDFSSLPNKAREPLATKRVVILGMLFVSFLIVANLSACKIVEFHLPYGMAINFPAALVFFPLTYFFDNVLTE